MTSIFDDLRELSKEDIKECISYIKNMLNSFEEGPRPPVLTVEAIQKSIDLDWHRYRPFTCVADVIRGFKKYSYPIRGAGAKNKRRKKKYQKNTDKRAVDGLYGIATCG